MASANDGIISPVANTGFIVDDRWTFINIDAVGDTFPGDRLIQNLYDVFSGKRRCLCRPPLDANFDRDYEGKFFFMANGKALFIKHGT